MRVEQRGRYAATDVPPPASRPSRYWTPHARLALATISVAQLVMVGVMSMAPVHMAHGGAELRMVGIVISFHTAGMYALSPVFGCLADRPGRIPVLTGGAAVLAVAFLVAGTAGPHDVARLSLGLFLLGLGWSASLVSGSALLVDAVPPADRAGCAGPGGSGREPQRGTRGQPRGAGNWRPRPTRC